MKTYYKISTYAVVATAFLFGFFSHAHAADISFRPLSEPYAGQEVRVHMFFAPGDDMVNAMQGEVHFDTNHLEFQRVSDAGSVISAWIEYPHESRLGVISFAGIIPGGYQAINSTEALAFEMVFQTTTPGETTIQAENIEVLLHAPIPEPAVTTTSPLDITINEPIDDIVLDDTEKIILDFSPPEAFNVHVVEHSELYNGNTTLVFHTQDKESGVDYYEVRQKIAGIWGSWERAQSPYPLAYPSVFSIIEVRAVDRVGLITTAQYINIKDSILILGIVLILVISILYWWKQRKRKSSEDVQKTQYN